MLWKTCETCGGNFYGMWNEAGTERIKCTNPDCENGKVDYPEDMKVYVTAYEVTRHFGGHEEGGWWYNNLSAIETIPCKNKYSGEIQEDLEEEYENRKEGNIYSVLGGTDVTVYIEKRPCENETKEAPIYE